MSPMLFFFTLGLTTAWATPSFDPTTPAASFSGTETETVDGAFKLWSTIERLHDPDTTLFIQEEFNAGLAWPDNSKWAPHIADCFEDSTPHSSDVLLHIGPNAATATGTPIVFVPGAGDNASRGFVTMATRMDNAGRPVFALTFAHPHGDVFQHAEQLANAIARVKVLTGADQVDVVSHSKGGISSAVYLSNHSGASWSRTDYRAVGTLYRGDVRRAVFIATPLGGVDTSYRWPGGNYVSLDDDAAIAPSSWESHYPYGSATYWIETDLSRQDFFAEDGDLFPGQRQLLARWDGDWALPGEQPWLGVYSLQQDWYTTYHGGYGYYSYSSGIDAAIAAGDGVLSSLATTGVDPDVELFVMAGANPVMPNGTEDFLALTFGEALVDLSTLGTDLWASFIADLVGNAWVGFGITEGEVQGLMQGKLLFGEISGPSDGVLFIDSALQTRSLTARGAVVLATETRDLSHLDLLYASPITGQLLKDEAAADPTEDGWKDPVGDRYIRADTLGWLEGVLADPAGTDDGDGGDSGSDDDGGDGGDGADGGSDGDSGSDGDGTGEDGGDGEDGTPDTEGSDDLSGPEDGAKDSGCSAVGGGLAGSWLFAAGLALVRRRR